MRKLKRSHKNLFILEAGFIYSKRHDLDYEKFFDDVFMTEDFNSSEGSEFDNIINDLRCYRYYDSYELKEISIEEYEMVVDEFGES